MKTKYAIGIDIGGTNIKYGLCSSEGEILNQDSFETPAEASKDEILKRIAEKTKECIRDAKDAGNGVAAIGVGTPGSVDVQRGFLMGLTPNFKHWRDVPIGEYLEKELFLPVSVDNDANLMAYGEYTWGTGSDKKNAVCITLGTGIGGGIIIDGEIYRGSFYAGAEIGHFTIDYNGRKCRCGGTGCWEMYASATAMIRDYNELNPESTVDGTREIFERYDNNDKSAREIIDKVAVYLGAGISTIINVFNPEIIIIGGGVSEAGDWFIEKIAESGRSRAMETSRKNVEIKAAQLGNRAGLLGAAAFALSRLEDK